MEACGDLEEVAVLPLFLVRGLNVLMKETLAIGLIASSKIAPAPPATTKQSPHQS